MTSTHAAPRPTGGMDTRAAFPALRRTHNGIPVAYFDGPGGTQVAQPVVDAMRKYLLAHNANTHWAYPSSAETDALIGAGREVFSDFFNCSPTEVVFGLNMTTLTFHVARALGWRWSKGDEIIVTDLDHHANIAPWRVLERERGVTVHSAPFDVKTGELRLDALHRLINSRTRLVAIGAASNAVGTINDIATIASWAREAGALVYVDAVHSAAHVLPDVHAIRCDFLAVSAYKFYGPHMGVLFARSDVAGEMDVPRLDPAPAEMPERLETGTQNHEGIVGSAAAVEFLASLGEGTSRRQKLASAYSMLHERGQRHAEILWEGLRRIPGVEVFGPEPSRPRTPTMAFTVKGKSAEDVVKELVRDALFLSHGDFYAATVIQRLGVGQAGVVRAGAACYTTEDEVDRLISAVRRIAS